MKWTKTAPTAPGWYWNKGGSFERGGPLITISLYMDDGEEPERLGAFSERHDEFITPAQIGGYWSDEAIIPPEGAP